MVTLYPGEDGWPAAKVFEGAPTGYCFDDIVFLPGLSSFEASGVDMSSKATKSHALRTPFISGGSDCVTEIDMAVSMALSGGLGVIHQNQTIPAQAEMVRRAKNFMSGFILDPVTLAPTDVVADVDRIKAERGFSGIPITQGGRLCEKLVGIVCARDIAGVEDRKTLLKDVMTPVDKMVVAQEPVTLKQARDRLNYAKVGKLPVVNEDGKLLSMLSRADIVKLRDYPDASRDAEGHLLVAASVSAEGDWSRARRLAEVGVDILFLDVTESNGDRQIDFIKMMKLTYPRVDIAVGPVSSCRQAKRFAEAGADAIRVGSALLQLADDGEIAPVGRAEASAVFQVARYVALNYGIPAIAEGSLYGSTQVMKALCLGASTVLLNDVLTGTDEAPKPVDVSGVSAGTKVCHRNEALGSIEPTMWKGNKLPQPAKPQQIFPAMQGSCAKGSVRTLIAYMLQGVKHGLQDLGLQSLTSAHEALYSGEVRLECRCAFASQAWEARKQAMLGNSHPEVMPILPKKVC